jgi:XRE family aerobic/anaerobic benzoate catabolism transcriptional regulator
VEKLLRSIARKVREARERRGLTAREAAKRSGVSARFYHLLERGSSNVSIVKLDSIARALGTSLMELFRPEEKKPVALLGLRGAGKSAIGSRLARSLGCPFVELDELIERRANLKLAEIFSLHGESYYRKLEADCVRDLLARGERVVVALPGGVVRNPEPFSAVRQGCTTVWLRARPEDHMKRVYLQGDRRPMADRADAMEELRNILREREPLYGLADLSVDTSAVSIAGSVREICGALDE